jgi:hypothetical protein
MNLLYHCVLNLNDIAKFKINVFSFIQRYNDELICYHYSHVIFSYLVIF